jgi:hypothetical protein
MARQIRRILFASWHCLTDSSSGAAIATLDALRLLIHADYQCRAFCASKVDARNFIQASDDRSPVIGGQVRKQRLAISSAHFVELTHSIIDDVPIQIFETESSRINEWLPGEPEAMLAAFERVVDDFRPDVLLTYGGDPVTRAVRERCRGPGVAFPIRSMAASTSPASIAATNLTAVRRGISTHSHVWHRKQRDC